MKKRHFGIIALLMIGCLICIFPLHSQTVAEPPSNFDEPNAGTEENPFLISNLANLRWLSETPEYWGSGEYASPDYAVLHTKYYYLQTADIDATETIDWSAGAGFKPIGRDFIYDLPNYEIPFWSDYNGDNYTISNLYIDTSISLFASLQIYTGLFGFTARSNIYSVRLIDVNFTGTRTVGGIVGFACYGSIRHSSSSGNITSYNRSNTSLAHYVGGLAGASSNAFIEYCSTDINIIFDGRVEYVGGLVGSIYRSTLTNSFFRGSFSPVTDIDYTISAISSAISSHCQILNIYISPQSNYHNVGFINEPSYNRIISCFWNTDTTNIPYEQYGSTNFGKSTFEMKQVETYSADYWNFDSVWSIDVDVNEGYPFLRNKAPWYLLPPENLEYEVSDFTVTMQWERGERLTNEPLRSYIIYRDDIVINTIPFDEWAFPPILLLVYEDIVEEPSIYQYKIVAVYDPFHLPPPFLPPSPPMGNPSYYPQLSDPVSFKVTINPTSEKDFFENPYTNSLVYPNPVQNSNVTFKIGNFAIEPSRRSMYIDIFNIKGQLVKRLEDFQSKDRESILVWDKKDKNGREVGSGVYFYKITPPPTPSMNGGGNEGKFIIIK